LTIDERLQLLLQSTESLHSTVQELSANAQRHDTQIAELIRVAQVDGENIRGLANIAERHQERLDALDGGDKE